MAAPTRTNSGRSPASTVTTSVVREVESGREEDFVRWTEAGISLVRTFPGFLGAGWVRTSASSQRYHVQYRFSDAASLREWLSSPMRSAWIAHGRAFSREAAVHQRTGIEGWFSPSERVDAVPAGALSAGEPSARRASPPRWKQAITIWLGFLPVSLVLNAFLMPHLGAANLLLQTLAMTAVCTPVMVYVVLPFLTSQLARWLYQDPPAGPARRAR
ncbi:antibiotic biosynthesis monooxygenase [Hoyosella altamirensis]|uniref:ABM domain-containing protein n=1 Tax=Hoyosella altamirensis TaxID=616997 RepID=A0A839RIV1_9ACTN|nr:antibiotic biosynthesis monooxygenase [Hoyosella altamirensis]MBB3036209.1 hypothetical protein [Hoyosella altamirensis]